MKIREFIKKIELPVFTIEQARRVVPENEHKYLAVQLGRWEKRGEIERIRRGLYLVEDRAINEWVLSSLINPGSYISLESALNSQGIIPDVSAEVTAIVTSRPRKYVTQRGSFSYSQINNKLFGGFEIVEDNGLSYRLAKPEKALLDWVYVRRLRDLREARIEWGLLDRKILKQLAVQYPDWVRKEIEKYV